MKTETNTRKTQSIVHDEPRTTMRCLRDQMPGSQSLSLKMKNQHATQKKSNRGKAQSLLDDENQLCGTEDIKCPEGKVYH